MDAAAASRAVRLIRDQELFRETCYINGRWRLTVGGASIPVDDPATGDIIGAVPKFGRPETREAIDAAAATYPAWRKRTAKERYENSFILGSERKNP